MLHKRDRRIERDIGSVLLQVRRLYDVRIYFIIWCCVSPLFTSPRCPTLFISYLIHTQENCNIHFATTLVTNIR